MTIRVTRVGTGNPHHFWLDRRDMVSMLFDALPQPLLSSKGCGWNDIAVEVYRFRQLNVVAQASEHVISIYLVGPVGPLQNWHGLPSVQTLHAGDIVIAPAGEPKRWQHDEEVEVVLLRLAPILLQQVAAGVGVDQPERIELLDSCSTRDPEIVDIGQRLLTESQAVGLGSHLYVESLTKQLAIRLLRHYSTISAPKEDFRAQLPRHKLRRATEYINANLGENLTLHRISEALAMSAGHFAHAFKQATGLPPHRYVIERRIDRAKSLLCETDLPIAEIAKQVGYSNQCHFSVVFHKLTGETPRRYRSET